MKTTPVPRTEEKQKQSDRYNAELMARAYAMNGESKGRIGELAAWGYMLIMITLVIGVPVGVYWLAWEVLGDIIREVLASV